MLIPLEDDLDVLLPVRDRRISFSLSDLGLLVEVVVLPLLPPLPLVLLPTVPVLELIPPPSADRLFTVEALLPPRLTPPLSEWLIAAPEPDPPLRWLLRLLMDDDVDDAPDWY